MSSGTGNSSRPSETVFKLDAWLWRGYAGYAAEELERIRVSPQSAVADRVHAALALGRYHAARDEPLLALEKLAFLRSVAPRFGTQKKVRWIEVHALLQLGRLDDARHLLDLSLRHAPRVDGDMCVAKAAVERAAGLEGAVTDEEATREALRWLSRPLERAGFVGLDRAEPDRPLALDNLAGAEVVPAADDGPMVSVLMAAYNAQDNITTAVRSILQQSWRNLEVVIVDDASSDDTWRTIQSLADQDARVRPLQHASNGGAYAARNTALARAAGQYVVVNDADDWAHPQKIEAQVRELEAHEGAGANMTFRLRVDPTIRAQPRLDSPHVPIIHNDFSALMVARERVLELGGWDPVRFSADAEFVERLRAADPAFNLRKIHPQVPLSISLFDGKNLTASSATSIWTNRFGARAEYERNFRHWHQNATDLRGDRTSQAHPFPVPALALNAPGGSQFYDVIVVSDFRLPGGTTHCNIHYFQAFREAGLRVAYLHWPRYNITPRDPSDRKILDACQRYGVVPLVHGENVRCKLLLIHHPPVMMWQPDAVPTIEAERVAILANQSSQRAHGGPHELYEPATVQANVERNFGQKGVWIPISPVVRQQMEAVGGFEPLWHQDWLPVLDVAAWHREPEWRGDTRARPTIGRHSRDQWIKWPGTAEAIASAYCADEDVAVRIMGGAGSAVEILGRQPANWQISGFDAEPVTEFLADLDIYVHFIHEASIEAFGRNIMEAMAMGLPVICSPAFRDCFGEAVICVAPEEVPEAIRALWEDRERYLAQAHAGQRFVAEHCSLRPVAGRVEAILSSVTGMSPVGVATQA